jgi:hypothetical protein
MVPVWVQVHQRYTTGLRLMEKPLVQPDLKYTRVSDPASTGTPLDGWMAGVWTRNTFSLHYMPLSTCIYLPSNHQLPYPT